MATDNTTASVQPAAAAAATQSYELVTIFTPVLSEEEYRGLQTRLQDFITAAGGEISHTEAWGMRTLAYPIAKRTTGYYWLMEYRAGNDVNARLETQMNREESILRHMITRLDKYALEYAARRRGKLSERASEERNNPAPATAEAFDNA